MDEIRGHVEQEFGQFTVESLLAVYTPFSRFLIEAKFTNDASVLYALTLDRVSLFPRSTVASKQTALPGCISL